MAETVQYTLIASNIDHEKTTFFVLNRKYLEGAVLCTYMMVQDYRRSVSVKSQVFTKSQTTQMSSFFILSIPTPPALENPNEILIL